MLLPLAIAAICAAVLAVLVFPLVGRVAVAQGSAEDVYAAQLAELDADRARGTISEADAAATRAEIARRLFRAHAATKGPAAAGSARPRNLAALAVVLFVPLFAAGGYLVLGAPRYPDMPLAARRGPDEATLARLAGEAEARIAQSPQDGEGWRTLAGIEMQRGRFAAAAAAFAKASEFLGERVDLALGRAESLVLSEGSLSAEAAAAFDRAAALARDAVERSVILAIAARHKGDLDRAARLWASLLEDSDGTEPWLPLARMEVMRIAAAAGRPLPGAAPAPAGAAANAEAQELMIEGMVASLAERLRTSGGSAEEWARLVRSYRVLGREDDARGGGRRRRPGPVSHAMIGHRRPCGAWRHPMSGDARRPGEEAGMRGGAADGVPARMQRPR